MSALEKDYPEWHEFLMWHKQRIRELYGAFPELTEKARNYVCLAIREGKRK